MTNAELNYETLTGLSDDVELEVCDVDVQRLRDDRSEIMSGDEVAFVAVAKFRIPPSYQGAPFSGLGVDLGAGDELFFIGNDAELRSDKFQMDEDGVIEWIRQQFAFTFTLNGSASSGFQPVGRTMVAPDSASDSPPAGALVAPGARPARMALPWLTKLNTVVVKDDYIDVDVKIAKPLPHHPGHITQRNTLWLDVPVSFGKPNALPGKADLHVEIDDLEKLPEQVYSIPLVSEDGGSHLRLKLRFSAQAEKAEPAHRQSHDSTTTKTKPRNR